MNTIVNRPTVFELAEKLLRVTPWLTATEVAHHISRKPSTVSGVLYKAVLDARIKRRPSETVRRGWEYGFDGQ